MAGAVVAATNPVAVAAALPVMLKIAFCEAPKADACEATTGRVLEAPDACAAEPDPEAVLATPELTCEPEADAARAF